MASQIVSQIFELVNPLKLEFEQVCSEPSLNFKRESEFAMQIFANNDYLAKVAIGNQVSTRSAIMNVAAIGITLNPAQKLGYLVPRKGAICLDISYMGLMHIAQQSGAIKWCQSAIVRKNDQFRREGLDKPPIHVYNDFDTAEQRGDVVGAYVVAKTDEGDYLTHTMRIEDIFAIRDRSEAWKKYKQDSSKKCPWVTDEEQMILKTVVKQSVKYWPRRERLDNAINHVNTEGEEGINFNSERQPEKDITPITVEQSDKINSILISVNSTFDSLKKACFSMTGRNVETQAELTSTEAAKLISSLERKLAKKSQGDKNAA
ncbi:recombinase RecT [Pectobacterium brasiliense]|uniref:recombinase RecT n=1 Tax=Pectobacterium brasiliense TaxID=180957 RepID=UPI00057DFD0C|nr:recombinase RecT [Pectobacterium brasiliense]KHS87104.1 recombinase RecT [Pectobacterium brasiliense]